MGLHHGYHLEYFFNDYNLGQLCERLLLKESYATIYWVLGNFLRKIIFRKLYVSNDCYEITSQTAFGCGAVVEIW